MNFDNFTDRARSIISEAQNLAIKSDHQQFISLHILKVLLEDEEGLSGRLIANCGFDPIVFENKVNSEFAKIPKVQSFGQEQLYMSIDAVKVLERAKDLAQKNQDRFVSIERILHAIVDIDVSSAGKIFKEIGLSKKMLEDAIDNLRKGRKADSETAEGNYEALNKYAKDVTELARQGKLDPVIGRDEEIRRTIQVLSRRIKNNPVLIGEPGVGKTAIIEGIAQRMIIGDVPESIRDCKLVSLDLGSLIAGAKFRGEFEERLKSVLNEISSTQGEIILFIDELHTLVGAGATEGSMDASNLLKPALARGELHCIGATTLNEYRKYIEKDAALARRFQSVYVSEPTIEDTISILRGIKEKYEMHHGIKITDSAIVAAATLSNRYITNRFLPDKAIDLIDEASSRLRMEVDSKPEEIDELDRKIITLKIEAEALKKENDIASKDRLDRIGKELEVLEHKSADLTSKWSAEKLKITNVRKVKEELEHAKHELEVAQRSGNLAKAGELAYGVIPELQKKIDLNEHEQENLMIKESITDQDIAHVISRITGIPMDKMLGSEKEKLLQMETHLGKMVIGQDEAVIAVSDAIRRARAGIQDINRPLGSFLFLGPTGVGKTELTKALAQFMFDDKSALLRFDMSEYMEKHAVSRLIGAPPGYVGYEEGGTLTEAVRRRPYQVILFDEVEKAHPDVFNILLQVLDEGRLTDSKGVLIDFKNTIVILTSNLGSEILIGVNDGDISNDVRTRVMDIVRSSFRPEFLNRLDEIIIFHKLERKHMDLIIDIQMEILMKTLKDRHIEITLEKPAKDWLADKGFDAIYGARPLKRIIQKEIQNRLAKMLIEGSIKDDDHVNISILNDNIHIEVIK